jgi:20S proteasome alpha/beta subunit
LYDLYSNFSIFNISNMSLVVSVFVPSGIVLAGDSRSTGTVTKQITDLQNPQLVVASQTRIVLSDAAHKVFSLHSRFGVAMFGDALIENMPISHYLEQFETLSARHLAASPLVMAQELLRYLRSLQGNHNVRFLFAAYDMNTPWLFTIDVAQNKLERINHDTATNQLRYSLISGGETDVIDRLVSKPEQAPMFSAMSLQDAVDYARHLIATSINQVRFEPRFASVGGAVDVLTVTSRGTKFISRKTLE